MGNRSVTEPFDGFSDIEFDDERAADAPEDSEEPSDNAKRPLPAWRRIEEYRELRELNRRVQDDIYEDAAGGMRLEWDPG